MQWYRGAERARQPGSVWSRGAWGGHVDGLLPARATPVAAAARLLPGAFPECRRMSGQSVQLIRPALLPPRPRRPPPPPPHTHTHTTDAGEEVQEHAAQPPQPAHRAGPQGGWATGPGWQQQRVCSARQQWQSSQFCEPARRVVGRGSRLVGSGVAMLVLSVGHRWAAVSCRRAGAAWVGCLQRVAATAAGPALTPSRRPLPASPPATNRRSRRRRRWGRSVPRRCPPTARRL